MSGPAPSTADRSSAPRAWQRDPGDSSPDRARRLMGSLTEERFTHAVVAFVDARGYPMSVATGFRVEPDRGVIVLDAVAGQDATAPSDREVNVVCSHIRPQPGQGYDERRYVSLWGRLRVSPGGALELDPTRLPRWAGQDS